MRRWSDYREFLLVADALLTGVGYLFGPAELRRSPALDYFDALPGGMTGIGAVLLLVAALLILGRFVLYGTVMRRWGHALGSGVYFLLAVGVLTTLFLPQDSGASWIHLLVIMAMHLRAASEPTGRVTDEHIGGETRA